MCDVPVYFRTFSCVDDSHEGAEKQAQSTARHADRQALPLLRGSEGRCLASTVSFPSALRPYPRARRAQPHGTPTFMSVVRNNSGVLRAPRVQFSETRAVTGLDENTGRCTENRLSRIAYRPPYREHQDRCFTVSQANRSCLRHRHLCHLSASSARENQVRLRVEFAQCCNRTAHRHTVTSDPSCTPPHIKFRGGARVFLRRL